MCIVSMQKLIISLVIIQKKTKEKYEAGGWKWWTMPATASTRVWTAAVAAMRFVDVGVVPNLSSREAAR